VQSWTPTRVSWGSGPPFSLTGLDDVIDTELMADTNGSGALELVALSRSAARAVVRDLLSGADLGTIQYSADLDPIALELGDDPTGTGIPDLASLGGDPARVQIRDALTSGLASGVEFSSYVTGTDLEVYPDLDGNGAADVALLGQRPSDDQLQVMVQDARTGERLAFVWF
jgi:hypothetical protein